MSRWFSRTERTHRAPGNMASGIAQPPQLAAPQEEQSENPLLLDQLRAYCQGGNWDALSRISADELKNHPDRAKLALLVAAANEQSGQANSAAEFLRLAKNWGASNREMAQLLVSGAHATLGRAWLITGSPVKAAPHFAKALPARNSPEAAQISADARLIYEAQMLNLPEKITKSLEDLLLPPTPGPTPEPRITLEDLAVEIKTSIKSEIGAAMRQLEAYMGIQSYLIHGHLPPALHGWPVSPDFGHYLIQSLEASQYDLVIEFGSGTSTLLIASVLERIQKRTGHSTKPTVQVAFEHLPKYFEKTSEVLEKLGLTEPRLVLAELEEKTEESDGQVYNYYKCDITLGDIARVNPAQKIFVVVDGPPASTGKHARYPAVPLMLEYFPSAELHVLLDDFARPDEKETVQKWIKLLKKKHRVFQHTVLNFEKGGSQLHIESLA